MISGSDLYLQLHEHENEIKRRQRRMRRPIAPYTDIERPGLRARVLYLAQYAFALVLGR